MIEPESLLSNLIRVCGRQGGTIWDYLYRGKNDWFDLAEFELDYYKDVARGGVFNSKEEFDFFAKEHNVKIDWR